jgi:cyclopropane-fatty-acyl-phospholipid synthase
VRVVDRDPATSAVNIRHHYDVGNEFFALWLDELCTYSCPLWDDTDPADDLDRAQVRKLDFHIRHARASGAANVLDVGCGWGGLLRRLVRRHGVKRAVGLTLSARQLAWNEAQACPGVEVRLESWFDHKPCVPYDAIISLGAFEHFGRMEASIEEKIAGYREYFRLCHEWLVPGSWMTVQSVFWGNIGRDQVSSFAKHELFPESDLPRLVEVVAACEHLFEIVLVQNDREQYERTHREWLRRLKTHRTEAVERVGESIVAHFERYLKISIIGFHTGKNDLLRLVLRRIDR